MSSGRMGSPDGVSHWEAEVVAPCLSFYLGLDLLHKVVLLLEGLPLGKGQVMCGTDPVKVGLRVDCVKSVA